MKEKIKAWIKFFLTLILFVIIATLILIGPEAFIQPFIGGLL